ncbi:MAG: hypothetical protein AVO33_06570 [delta proteobacterium ML8_F1]|nr:MAG: hypothetical protein AVO33_06570 [delta proteobacterium ML8_F1]
MERLFKVLGDTNRLRLIHILTKGELCVCELEVILDLTQSNVSRHLTKLREEGILEGYKDGLWIHYRITEEFKSRHRVLFSYLVEEFQHQKVFTRDLERYQRYTGNHLSCTLITQDRRSVINLIEK